MKEAKGNENCLNLILQDFYICKGKVNVYKGVAPTILAERVELKVVVVENELLESCD
jgi:hypothetical protein